jgi:hypothetical protein
MACPVVIAGQRLMEPQCLPGWHKGERSRRAPVGTQQGDLLTPRAVGALTGDRHSPCREPMPGWARPASSPTLFVVYQSRTTTIETQPKSSTRLLVMAMPHHALGLVGRGLLPVGGRLALSCGWGVTNT